MSLSFTPSLFSSVFVRLSAHLCTQMHICVCVFAFNNANYYEML